MTDTARKIENKSFTLIQSDIVTVGTTIDLGDIDAVRAHCFVGAQFFSDSGGATSVVPTAGVVTIAVQTVNSLPTFEVIPSDEILAATPTTLSWAANTVRVRATPTTPITGGSVTHYRIIVTCNET